MDLSPYKRTLRINEQVHKIIQILKFGQKEKRFFLVAMLVFLASFFIANFGAFPIWLEEYKSPTVWILRILGMGLVSVGVLLVWQKVVPPPEIDSITKPPAIKGPLAFGPQDGELFTQLGRTFELEQIYDFILKDQYSFIVLMGESGAGKSSLLRAGVEYSLESGKTTEVLPCIYWEALPTDPVSSLLTTLRQKWQGDEKPESLEALFSSSHWAKHVILIDQGEQLTPHEHPEVFQLFKEIMSLSRGGPITWIFAFREEYLVTWSKYLISNQIPYPPTIIVDRFSAEQARRIIATLASASDINLSESVMRDLIQTISQSNGKVSPVEIGISMLVLSELGRGNQTLITEDVYQQAGKADGMLATYIESHLKRMPEFTHEPILKALISLFDLETNQRIAEGRSTAELSNAAGMPAADLESHFSYFSSAHVRILQRLVKSGIDNTSEVLYRLSHERIIPAIRRLTGRILVEAEQARIILEKRFRVWKGDRQNRDLLTRKEFKFIIPYVGQFSWGEDQELKKQYIRACRRKVRRENWRTAAGVLAVLMLAAGIYFSIDEANTRYTLNVGGLPSSLHYQLEHVDTLIVRGASAITQGASVVTTNKSMSAHRWRKSSFDSLSVYLYVWRNRGVILPDSVENLNLSLGNIESSFEKIKFPKNLKNLDVRSPVSMVSLKGLPEGLSRLKIYHSGSYIQSLEGLPEDLLALDLNLGRNSIQKLNGLPAGLNSASLSLQSNYIQSLEGLPDSLTELSLDVSDNLLQDLEGLPKGLKSLYLGLRNNQIKDLSDLFLPDPLENLSLDLSDNQLKSLETLKLPINLKSLRVTLRQNQLLDMSSLRYPPSLMELNLELNGAQISDLQGLNFPPFLDELTIDLLNNTDLQNLDKFKLPANLKALNLTLQLGEQINLSELTFPSGLKNLNLSTYSFDRDSNVEKLEFPPGLEELSLQLSGVKVKEFKLPNALRDLSFSLSAISSQNLHSFNLPSGLSHLSLSVNGNQIQNIEGFDFPENLSVLSLSFNSNEIQDSNELTSLAISTLPTSLDSLFLNISGDQYLSLEDVKLPKDIRYFRLSLSGYRTRRLPLLKLPSFEHISNLHEVELYLSESDIEDLKVYSFPPNLKRLTLNLSGNRIKNLQDLKLPQDLEFFGLDLRRNPLTSVADLQLPDGLKHLNIQFSSINLVEPSTIILPSSLLSIDINYGFSSNRDLIPKLELPESLESLMIMGSDHTQISQWPKSIKRLEFFVTN